jgi:tRNA threonylcarbamoyladenosine biosynthesis protein TsaB
MPSIAGPLLALDTGSPTVSVAVGLAGRVLASREVAMERSSETLLGLVDEVLRDAGFGARQLAGIVALRGPGSFTGLRVGLATVLGLHQSLGVPATALPTLDVLAMLASPGPGRRLALVNALRGEWFAQEFAWDDQGTAPWALGPAEILAEPALAALSPATVLGFGVERLRELWPTAAMVTGAPLAGAALRFATLPGVEWRVELLTAPLYLRAPAVTPLVP